MKSLILSLVPVMPTLAWASSFEALMDYCLNLPDKAERDRCVHSLTHDIEAMGFRMMQQPVQPFPARPSLSCMTVGTITTCD